MENANIDRMKRKKNYLQKALTLKMFTLQVKIIKPGLFKVRTKSDVFLSSFRQFTIDPLIFFCLLCLHSVTVEWISRYLK